MRKPMKQYKPDARLAHTLKTKFPSVLAYLNSNPYIARDIGLHASKRVSTVLEDAFGLIEDDNPIAKVNIAVAVGTLCIAQALKEAGTAMGMDTDDVNVGPLLDEILGAVQSNIKAAMVDVADK